jgi:hypothetical protein
VIRLVAAQPSHLIALLLARAELTVPARRYAALLSQVALSEAYAVLPSSDDAPPLAIAGIAPLPDVSGGRAGEIWFGARLDGLGAGLLPVVRCAREVIASRVPDYPGGLMCLVRDGHHPGERLARLIGCGPQPVLLGEHREWTWGS